MIYLELFLSFLKVGALSFGGGYGMVAILFDEIEKRGWMTDAQMTNMIAVSESTPGPIAVNMATFVGYRMAGGLGGVIATVGVILPAFIIVLIIAALLTNLMKYKGVQAFLNGIRPCIVGLIVATTFKLAVQNLSVNSEAGGNIPDYRAAAILVVLVLVNLCWKKYKKSKPSPIAMIMLSAILGIVTLL